MSDLIKPRHRAANILEEAMQAYVAKHKVTLLANRKAGEDIAGSAVAGLSGICALIVKGGNATRDEAIAAMTATFTQMLDRDLKLLEDSRIIKVQ